jgi:sugar phosphate isomerase/epimerase
MTMPLSGCSFGWLHLAPLPDALRVLARHGFGSIELTTAPPHLSAPTFGRYERQELLRLLNALGLRVLSVNPSFADINLISTNPEFRELSERQLLANIELAADLGAEYVVVIPGRRHALAPAPDDVANALAIEDPADGVRQAAKYLALAHVSDTWRDTWAHTAAGTAEVDFGGFAAALQDTGFAGPTVYELVDGLDPEPRLPAGLATLAAAGWAP